ncbi:MAG: Asp23/Gls24 family envelope stress response protein [Thermoleophilia bacterium]|nr:Asp23/Gls24 family envelope stress response protein [Thermoleophilia bacterium]
MDAAATPLGRITISREAIAEIVARTVAECYGVVGMAGRRLRRKAIDVSTAEGGGLKIDVHVVVEYGLNLAEVGNSIRARVRYEVERLTQLPVAAVEVHIEDVRR